jgi:hypothetical protein
MSDISRRARHRPRCRYQLLRGASHRSPFGIIPPCHWTANSSDPLPFIRPKNPANTPLVVTSLHFGDNISPLSLRELHWLRTEHHSRAAPRSGKVQRTIMRLANRLPHRSEFVVLHGIWWLSILRDQIEFSAEEEDSSTVVLEGPEASGVVLDGLDAAVETFGV